MTKRNILFIALAVLLLSLAIGFFAFRQTATDQVIRRTFMNNQVKAAKAAAE
jgi:hypothetical protein